MSGVCLSKDKNLYKVLGCSPDSSLDVLKQAYHRLILETHPDKNCCSSNNLQTFLSVKKAWEVLGNPDLKKQYDHQCEQANFEAESLLIYARLTPKELEATEDEDVFSYPCRCGNNYLVQRTDLQETHNLLYVPCQDCTFSIVVET